MYIKAISAKMLLANLLVNFGSQSPQSHPSVVCRSVRCRRYTTCKGHSSPPSLPEHLSLSLMNHTKAPSQERCFFFLKLFSSSSIYCMQGGQKGPRRNSRDSLPEKKIPNARMRSLPCKVCLAAETAFNLSLSLMNHTGVFPEKAPFLFGKPHPENT